MIVTCIRGRWPERRIPLQAVDMRVQVRHLSGGRVWLRLDNKLRGAFWMELDLVVESPSKNREAGGASCDG